MSKTRYFLSNGISHFALIAALAVVLPIMARAADVDVTAPGSDNVNGVKTIANGQSGDFITAADATSILNYAGGGTLGNGGAVITNNTLDGAGILRTAGASTLNGTIGSSGHSLSVLDLGGDATSFGNNFIGTVNLNGHALSVGNSSNTFTNLNLGTGGVLNVNSGNTFTVTNTTGAGSLSLDSGVTTLNFVNIGTSGTPLSSIATRGLAQPVIFNAISAANIYTNTFDISRQTAQFTGASTTINSNITTSFGGGGNGVVSIGNTSTNGLTVNGDIGTSSRHIGSVSFANASGNFLTVTGNLYTANGFSLNNNTVTFGGVGASTVDVGSGQSITTNSNGNGIINLVGAGGVTVANALGTSAVNRIGQLNINGTGTDVLNGANNYITATNFGADGGLTLGSGVNLTSPVTTTTNGTGTLTLGANGSLTGAAGATNFSLKQMNFGSTASASSNVFATTTNFNGANATTSTIGGTLNTTNVNFANNSTANITGASTITGNVTTAGGDGTGTLGINGNSSIAGNVGANGASLNALNYTGSGNTLTLGGVDRLTAFNISGSGNAITYGIGAGSVLGTAFTDTNNTFNFTANDNASSVQGITAPGAQVATANLNVSAVDSNVGQRTAYYILQNSNNTAVTAPTSFTIGTAPANVHFLTYYNDSADNGVLNQFGAIALQNSYYTNANAAAGGNNASFAAYLDNNVAGRATDINGNTVRTYLNTLDAQIVAGNNAGAQNTLQQGQAQPQTQVNVATRTANEEFIGVVDDHMFKTHTGSTGKNSGDEIPPGRSVWIEAFGGVGDQNSRDGYSGFNSRTGGVAVGADQQVGRNSLLGLAGSYAYSRVKSEDVDQKTTIDTYQGALYGQTYFTPQWFLMGQAGGAFNHYQGSRGIPAGGVGASSDYDGWGYFANAKTGYDLPLQDGFMLTPFAALTHIGNHLDSYTETGAGGLDLSVASSNPRTTTGRIGAQLAKSFVTENRTILRPQIRLDYLHDFQRDDQATTANFNGTGVAGTFTTNGIIQNRNGIDAGLGLDIMAVNNLTFSANYNYQWRDGYSGNSGLLKAQYNF